MKVFSWIVLLTGVLVVDRLLEIVSTSSSPSSTSSSSSPGLEVLHRIKRARPTDRFAGKHIFEIEEYVKAFREKNRVYPNENEVLRAIQLKTENALRGRDLYNDRDPRGTIVSMLILTNEEKDLFDREDEPADQGNLRNSAHDYTVADIHIHVENNDQRQLTLGAIHRGKIRIGYIENTAVGHETNHFHEAVSPNPNAGNLGTAWNAAGGIGEKLETIVERLYKEEVEGNNAPNHPDKLKTFEDWQTERNNHPLDIDYQRERTQGRLGRNHFKKKCPKGVHGPKFMNTCPHHYLNDPDLPPTNQPSQPTNQPSQPTNQPSLPTNQPSQPTNQPSESVQ